jgi:predicted metal-dependent peptidase
METLPTKVKFTYAQEQAMVAARVAFMRYCPFFCHYYSAVLVEYPTLDLPTLATDGKRVFVNPDYMLTLGPAEMAFALAHEVYHCVRNHPQRSRSYRLDGKIKGCPYDHTLFNIAEDYTINADLVDNHIGAIHPSWLYDRDIKADELPEDVYVRLYNNRPPPQGQGQQPQPGGSGGQPGPSGGGQGQQPSQPPSPVNPSRNDPGQNKTYRDIQKSTRHDKAAEEAGGAFDDTFEPFTDVNGKEDIPSGMEFKEAVARAAAAAKAMGNMPGSLQRVVDEILEPQVLWREHLRMLIAGKIGARKEDWARPNRRRLVLNPIVILPGKRGYGSNLVVCVVDNSGSVSNDEMKVFFSEMTGILDDCKPKRVMVIWCDAAVRQVDEASTLDELQDIRVAGAKGGGGTSFIPPFKYLDEENIEPDTLIYLTDMLGPFPEQPVYPVVWCATTDKKAPFGETVRIKV